jgi:hypothetical protein
MVVDIMKLPDEERNEIIQQYEDIRSSGLCNMFNYTDVKYVAERSDMYEIYEFIKDSIPAYASILKNFSILMKEFDIKQN